MFSKPMLEEGRTFPEFPGVFPDDLSLFEALGVPHVRDSPDPIRLLADFAMANWIGKFNFEIPPLTDEQKSVMCQLGMIETILPSRESYDAVLVDGGSKPVFDYRLDFIDNLVANGLTTSSVIVFGGQRLRCDTDDSKGTLEDLARQLSVNDDPWVRAWLVRELDKGHHNQSQWDNSFATEHEVAVLALLERYGERLKHTVTHYRDDATSVSADIPPTRVHSEEFDLDGIAVRVLNAPAIEREFRGEKFFAAKPRPTGRSCFYEWVEATSPPIGSSVLLVNHNPHVYRSWMDLLLAARTIDRQDLYLEGAGAAKEPRRPHEAALQDLGRLLVNFSDPS